jgi:hypothetical protein
MDLDRIAGWYRDFVAHESPPLPFYAALCEGIADDVELVGLVAGAAPGQWRPNLLLAALHDQVLLHPDEPFARFYPTVGGDYAPGDDVMGPLREFLAGHTEAIEHLIATRSTQTNEVNRSCLWQVALRAAASDEPDRPLALVEVGASAGLNLAFDRYRYDFGDGVVLGDERSPVRLSCDLRSGRSVLDRPLPCVVHRIGLDVAPVDLHDADERRWLKACIWPEQPVRHQRFDAAADLAIADPPVIVADDAVDGISDLIEGCPDEAHVVIVNSWVMTYLARERREAFERVVAVHGAERDITRISAEGETVVDWVPPGAAGPNVTVVGMARWRNGDRTDERVAECQPHLQWLEWNPAFPTRSEPDQGAS